MFLVISDNGPYEGYGVEEFDNYYDAKQSMDWHNSHGYPAYMGVKI